MTNSVVRLTHAEWDLVERYIRSKGEAWIVDGIAEPNSFGLVASTFGRSPSGELLLEDTMVVDHNQVGGKHPPEWYVENAYGKREISRATGMDSLVAVRMNPGLVANVQDGFAWGGAVIDFTFGLIVAISGFKEDEDVQFAKDVLNFIIMLINRRGKAVIDDAHKRAKVDGVDQEDRMTRPLAA